MSESVAIVGAGVSGLTCGVMLTESGRPATIFAAEEGTGIASAAAAAIWYPYDAEPCERVIPWALETFAVLKELSREDGPSGVSMIELRKFSRSDEVDIPDWAGHLGARNLAANELVISGAPSIFRDGFVMTVPLTDTTIYLRYLRERFIAAGGSIRTRRLDALEEVSADFGVVVNCAGIGARELAPDAGLEPHRGQVVLVSPTELNFAVVCDDPPLMYAVPRSSDCLFGGTNAVSEKREPDPAETAAILHECCRVLGIPEPSVLGEAVGLRPFRKEGVRVEVARLSDGRAVVHNYGHGGSGFTLSWGCAREVLELASQQRDA
jgi:D-amino-acid oxidase